LIDQPVFVNSIPKSGTYLLAAILEELGLEFTHWHVFETFYDDYTDAPLNVARAHPERFRIRQPVSRTISRLRPCQFAVGHLCYNERTRRALRDCYVIFLKRDLRECLVSHMRWQSATGRDRSAWTRIDDPQQRMLAYLSKWGRSFVKRACAIGKWHGRSDYILSFDDLIDARQCQRFADAVGVDFEPNALSRARARRTLTKLVRSDAHASWCEAAEHMLDVMGGLDLNSRLGFQCRSGTPATVPSSISEIQRP